jgi:TP901 family phage tail tape measure protein
VAERAVEAELRQALAAAAKLKVAAAEADAAASNVADRVRRGEVQPGDIQREVKKEVARGNVQRRVGGGGVGRAGDVARETRDVEKLTKAEREEARESARAAREKQLARQGGAAQRLQAYETRIGEKEARGDFQGIQSMYRKAERLRGELQQEVRAADQAQARAASRERRTTPLQPRASAGGGGLRVVQEIDRLQRQGEAREARASQTQAGSFRERLQATRAIEESEKRAAVDAQRHAEALTRTLARDLSSVRGGGPVGGIAGPPPPPPPPPPPRPPAPPTGGGGDAGDPEQRRIALQRAVAAERSMAFEEARLRAEFQRTSVVLGSQSDILRRHGALTTEFITAAARGETTFRELGYQAGATIGKFAGWIGAGAAVFGVVDAVRQLYEGAIQTDRGVASLDRVVSNLDADSARVSFGKLADEFNLPIADVSDAAFQMAKVFHNQDDAFKASRAVLNSVKVGELDVADASRFLIAVINGFKLPASDMVGVFDQINQAQNKFGIGIRDTEAGLAKAAGTFKAASGDLDPREVTSYALALITTAQKVTGNTGDVIGTALARSPNFLRKPQNVEILKQYGIDATAPLPEIFQKAFAKARTLSGQELQKLAAAIGGPQYGARVFTPLLQAGERFKRVLRETSPEASKNSAAKELDKALKSIDERAKAVGIELQQIGANLSRAGFGSVLLVGLDALNQLLDGANAVLGVFNRLPEPLRHMLTLVAQVALVMRGLQRFRFGDFLADRGAPPAIARRFNQPEPQYLTRLARRGGRDEQTYLREDLTRATSGQRLAQREAVIIAARERETQGQIATQLKAKNLSSTEQANLASAQLASEQRVIAAKEAVLAAEVRQTVLTEELAGVEERNSIINNRRASSRKTEAAVSATDIFIPGTLERPTSIAPIGGSPLHPADHARINALAPGMRAGAQAAALQRAAIEAETAAVAGFAPGMRQTVIVTRAQTAALAEDAARRTTLAQEFRRARVQFPILGSAGAAVIGGARRLARDGGRARTTLTAEGVALKGAASGLRKVIAGIGAVLGPLDLLLIAAAIGIPLLIEQVKKNQEKARALARAPRSAADAKRLVKELRKDSEPGRFTEDVQQLGHDYLPFPLNRLGRDNRADNARKAARADRLAESNRRRALEIQSGTVIDRAFPSQIDASVKHTVDQYNQGEITLTDALRRIRNAVNSVKDSHQREAAKRQQEGQLRARAVEINPSNKALFQRYAEIGTDILKKRAEDFEALIQAGGAGQSDITRYSTIISVLASRYARKPGLKSRRALAEVSRQQIGALQAQAQEELGVQLAQADTDKEKAAAYRRYENVLRRGVSRGRVQALRGLRRLLHTERVEVRGVQTNALALIAEARALAAEGSFNLVGERRPNQALSGISGPLEQAKRLVAQRRRQMHDLRRFFKRQMKQIDDVIGEMTAGSGGGGDDGADAEALYQAQTELGQYRYARGLPRIGYQIRRIGGAITQAIRQHGRNSVEVLQLMAEQASLQEQASDEQFSIVQAQGQIREAGLEGAQLLRVQLSNTAEQIGYLQSHGGSQAEILGLVAQQRQLQHDLLLAAREDIESIYDLRSARTEDPVKQARLEYQRDRAVRRKLTGVVSPQEQRRNVAAEIRSRRALRDRIVEEELADIQYRESIGKLTNDQEIQALQRLLRSHKASRDIRRRIKEQIYQLQHENETELDLDVGSIRLPTAYDIRRIAQQGTATAPGGVVQQNNAFTFNVRNQGDAETIGAALDSIYGTQTTAMMRSAGLR